MHSLDEGETTLREKVYKLFLEIMKGNEAIEFQIMCKLYHLHSRVYSSLNPLSQSWN
jgi:hypothetical protein